jgi:hypothetical protein
MKILLPLAGLLFLAACQHAQKTPDLGLVGFDPNLIENQRQACTAAGGQFGKGGASDVYICYQRTKDANQSCSAGTDCQGLCLARSQSCAPVTPLLGCQDILTDSGTRATLCLD